MIHDLDETLKQLLIREVPIDTNAVDIKFETPDKDWDPKPTKPTVNCFLYDIRENHELRINERFLTRNADNTQGVQTVAPVRIDLGYYITTWTTDVADEHRLLGNILTTLLRFPILPDDVLQGSLVNPPKPLKAWIAQPEKTPNVWDIWGAVEGLVKAGLSYQITVSVQPSAPVEVTLTQEVRTDLVTHDVTEPVDRLIDLRP